MPKTITAEFKSRRDAEMAIEHLVQEHGLDRSAVRVGPAGEDNTVGTEAARADVEDGGLKTETEGGPALAGKVRVSADVDDAVADKAVSSLETYGGSGISS